MIQLKSLSKSFSQKCLFKDVNFTLARGEKLGLVGRNGSGKSTLFKIIKSDISSDSGELCVPNNYKVAFVDQHIEFSKDTVLKEVSLGLSKEKEFETYRAEKILMGLGFSVEDFQEPPLKFSGGYQVRISLAKALVSEPNLLLLDEPTNYLDITSMRWIKRFLREFSGEIILISHDRGFMDEVCGGVMGIHRSSLIKINGTTSKYYEKVLEEEKIHEQTRLNQEKKIKDTMEFVTKFKAKANKASQAQSKLKSIERIDVLEKLSNINDLNFRFNYFPIEAKTIVNLVDLKFGYDENEILIQDLSLTISKSDKIAIIGKNGKGKSTLLCLISVDLNPLAGEIKLHNAVKVGFFGQTNIERLHLENTIDEEITSANTDLAISRVKSICATMMFSQEDSDKKIKILSGGEKSRVLLGKILANKTNLLLLDEPSNHLDQESIESLISEINKFEGASLMVSHNEYILRNFATKLIIFQSDKVSVFDGNYDEFLNQIGWECEGTVLVKEKKLNKKDQKRMRSELIEEKSKSLRTLKASLIKTEKDIEKKEARITQLNELFLTELDSTKIQEASIEHGKIQNDLENDYGQYELVSAEIEKIELMYEEKFKEINLL